MKQPQTKPYGGKWDESKGYYQKHQQQKPAYTKQITYPWKNQQKAIQAT